MSTTSTEISNTYTPGYYDEGYLDEDGNVEPYSSGEIAGTGKIVSVIEGDLAERILARAGKRGTVTIIEDHWDIGYCVTCSDEQVDFEVQVDGETVFRTEYADYGGEIRGALAIGGYAQFNEWLVGE